MSTQTLRASDAHVARNLADGRFILATRDPPRILVGRQDGGQYVIEAEYPFASWSAASPLAQAWNGVGEPFGWTPPYVAAHYTPPPPINVPPDHGTLPAEFAAELGAAGFVNCQPWRDGEWAGLVPIDCRLIIGMVGSVEPVRWMTYATVLASLGALEDGADVAGDPRGGSQVSGVQIVGGRVVREE